ncbi:hypothetical protein [Chryseobacterium sp. 2987]|uniref:hypothetical protein n=1 Tax=Chryseobacterium sp. 2987 TaxID=2817767 RepID=UPI002862419E|nr:hypothetical protein [Chryseobacterium sp. 2987]MDR6919720.1 hypothetical protein [Chryseobacterium sp. 2987]
MKHRITHLFLLLLGLLPMSGTAQNRYTDSLYNLVRSPAVSGKERVMILSQLANRIRYYNQPEALKLAQQAIALAGKEKDTKYKVYAYEARSAVYLSMQEIDLANKDTDNSIAFAGQTKDIKAQSWAWYGKGRALDYQGNQKDAVAAELKALQLIKGKGYWKEEASIYYAFYGIFSTWEDVDNEGKYALLSLEAAKKSGDPNNLCESWQAVGSAAADRFRKTQNRKLLDSALAAQKKSVEVYIANEPYMKNTQLISIPSVNIADAYSRHFPASAQITDSIRHYADIALRYATKGKDMRMQAASFGIMNEDAKRNGNFELAETYLLQALSLMLSSTTPDYYIRSSIYRDLADLTERKKNYAKALEYQKAYQEDYRKIFDSEQNSTGKKLEAQYQAKGKEQEIKYLKERESLHKTQKYLYIGIAVALLLGLLFMFRSYHFRLKYSLQRGKILEQEREEARLLAQVKQDEALIMAVEKEKAELLARLKEKEADRLQTEQMVILAQKELLQKEVLAGNLQVEQKNKILQNLKNQLEENPGKSLDNFNLNKILKEHSHIDRDFEEFKTDLREIHPDFYNRLQEKAGHRLTSLDLKYCAYIFMNRSTKEMAVLLNVEPKSIRMSKYRLKQKLGLEKADDLDEFIRKLV